MSESSELDLVTFDVKVGDLSTARTMFDTPEEVAAQVEAALKVAFPDAWIEVDIDRVGRITMISTEGATTTAQGTFLPYGEEA